MNHHLVVCFSKIVHPNRHAALAHIRQVGQDRKAHAKGLKAYHCPQCGNWHVGHARKRGKTKKR